MACGVHWGILLICLIEAEHVLCLWAQQARGQNSNTDVGFSQQSSGFGGSDSQNQLRRASGSRGSSQSSSLNTDVSGGYSQRIPSSGYRRGVSQAARRGYPSVRLVPSSSESKANWPKTRLSHGNVQKRPNDFGLSTNIAGGSSISRYRQYPLSKKRTWPVQQGPPSTSNYRSSSSESLRESYAFKPASHQSAAQTASSLSSTGAAGPHRIPARTRTSASAPATRVSSGRNSVASKPSYFPSPQNVITRNNPSQTETGNQYPSKLFAQGTYKPASASHMASSHQSYSQSPPVSNKHSAPAGFHPSRGNTLTSYTSTEQVPSSKSSLQTYWNNRNSAQGARNLPVFRTKSEGISAQRFALTRIYNIPQRFGGYAIIRLKKTADQKEVSVRQWQAHVAPQPPSAQQQATAAPQPPSAQQQATAAPQPPSAQQQATAAPQPPSAQQQATAAPQPPSAQQQATAAPQPPSAQQQAHVAPQPPSAQQETHLVPQPPSAQQQAYLVPQPPSAQQQAYLAPQPPSAQQQAYLAPQPPSAQQEAYLVPQPPSAQQEAYLVPQPPSASYKPRVQRVHPVARWIRIPSYMGK